MTAIVLPDLRWCGMFEGYSGLSSGVLAVTGGRLVAVAEWEPPTVNKHTGKITPSKQAPARLLAHRLPEIPNLGNVSLIDWAPWRGQIDAITAGFPCQDVSHAGLRGGMQSGNRSGLWSEVARAIDELRPALVLIENVPGLRSARAGDPTEVGDDEAASDVEPVDDDVRSADGGDARPVRGGAFRVVLDDLAALGFDAEWVSVRASDVGAPHRRERVFILAYADWVTGIVRAA